MNVLSSNSRNDVSSSLCLNNVFYYEPPESRRASSCRDVKEEHRLMRRSRELWPWAWKQSGVTVSNPDDLTPLFSTQRGKLDSCVTGTEVRVFQPSCLATHSVCVVCVCVCVCVISYTCNMRALECFGNISNHVLKLTWAQHDRKLHKQIWEEGQQLLCVHVSPYGSN